MVVTRDGLPHLRTCLPALLEQELAGGFEVLLVDNGSTDGTQAWVRAEQPAVRLVEAGRNLGFAAGNNLGFREAGGEHLVLLNNDARPRPGWLAALVGAVGPGVGAVASRLLYAARPHVLQSAGTLLLSDGAGGDRGMDGPAEGRYLEREEVFGFNGAAALLSRDALADTGAFDASYFMYYEDLDLSWRLRLRGWRVVYEPGAVVEHEHAGSSRAGSAFFHFHADRNRLFTLVKDAPAGFLLRSLAAAGRQAGTPGSGAPRPPGSLRRVALSLTAHLPQLAAKRAWVRGRRRVPDRDVLRWLYPRQKWDARSG